MISHSQLLAKLKQLGFDKHDEKDGFITCRSSLGPNMTTFKTRTDYTVVSARFILHQAGYHGMPAQTWIDTTAEENKTAE